MVAVIIAQALKNSTRIVDDNKKGISTMAISEEYANRYVARGRQTYYELTPEERRAMVAALIREMRTIHKGGLLADVDHDIELPDLVADIIEERTPERVDRLITKIHQLFISGTHNYDPFFADDVDNLLEEELDLC